MEAVEILALVSGKVDQELLLRNYYLGIENQILKSKIEGRIPFTDEERARLASAAEPIGQKGLKDVPTIVTPETLMKWYRELIAKKFDGSKKRKKKKGRPTIDTEIEILILQFALENPSWGYDRIVGALKNLGYNVSDETVGNVLKRHGIPPAPDRDQKATWAEFIRSHMNVLVACDFFTAEVLTPAGLITYYILFFIHLDTRKVHIAGITPNPDEVWMKQIARNITMEDWGFLKQCGCKYLIHDRDTKFCESFLKIIRDTGVELLKLLVRSPDLNAFAERFVLSIKSQCLAKLIFFGEDNLINAVNEYEAHYHEERNHQGKDNVILFPGRNFNPNENA